MIVDVNPGITDPHVERLIGNYREVYRARGGGGDGEVGRNEEDGDDGGDAVEAGGGGKVRVA